MRKRIIHIIQIITVIVGALIIIFAFCSFSDIARFISYICNGLLLIIVVLQAITVETLEDKIKIYESEETSNE